MRICIFGAGSLGSAIGWFLAKDNEVTLIGRRPQVSAVRRHGLRLMGDRRGTRSAHAFESVDDVGPQDLLILTTKAYDTPEAIEACVRWAGAPMKVLTLQNGLGNLEMLRSWKGKAAFGGTTTMGATLLRPGVVRLSGLGITTIGSDQDDEEAVEIASVFSRSGVPVTVKPDISSEIWMKAIVSSCINPLTAILRVTNGRLTESPVLARMIREVAREGEQVAVSQGAHLRRGIAFARVMTVCRDTYRNTSSMFQDLEKGRRTEISQINGAICEFGEARGIPTPFNRVLSAMVVAMESAQKPKKG